MRLRRYAPSDSPEAKLQASTVPKLCLRGPRSQALHPHPFTSLRLPSRLATNPCEKCGLGRLRQYTFLGLPSIIVKAWLLQRKTDKFFEEILLIHKSKVFRRFYGLISCSPIDFIDLTSYGAWIHIAFKCPGFDRSAGIK
jgi:hypothetical protein